MLDGIGVVRRIMAQPALAGFDAGEVVPGPDAAGPEQLEAWIRRACVTVHHPSSTCRMGPDGDPGRVVDAALRVCGTERLRVVDASVMPDVAGGNINAVVMMIAEKAADMLLDRPAPAGAPAERTEEFA